MAPRSVVGLVAGGLILSALAAISLAAEPAGAPAPGAKPTAAASTDQAADVVVLSRTDHSETLVTNDLPLIMTKAGRVERAIVRRAIFISSSVSLTRPSAQPVNGPQSCQWQHASFLQRQICFSTMAGLFACTEADVQTLPEAADGEMRITDQDAKAGQCADAYPASATARAGLSDQLKARAQSMFDDDQKTKVDPILKAAGVAVRPGRVVAP